jgi:hypothetical protein
LAAEAALRRHEIGLGKPKSALGFYSITFGIPRRLTETEDNCISFSNKKSLFSVLLMHAILLLGE